MLCREIIAVSSEIIKKKHVTALRVKIAEFLHFNLLKTCVQDI